MIKFADGRHITLGEKGDISVVRKDGRKVIITNMLYVPSTTSNLINVGQLLVKGYNLKLEKNQMKVYHGDGRLIMKAPLPDNTTIKVESNTVNHKCLASTIEEYNKWLWHYMYRNLNFISLGTLNQKKMVYSLPQVKEPSQACEKCCKAKYDRKSFKHDLPMRSKKKMELVHCVDHLK